MTDGRFRSLNRRRVLAAFGTAGMSGLAGCNFELNSSEVTDPPEDEQTNNLDDNTGTRVSFDFGAKRNPFFTHEEFETLRLAFQGAELRSIDGDQVHVEAEGPEFDMTELSTDDSLGLVEADIPPGSYAELSVNLPVVEATLVDGNEPITVQNADSQTVKIGFDREYDVALDNPITFNLIIAVIKEDSAWNYTIGYENY